MRASMRAVHSVCTYHAGNIIVLSWTVEFSLLGKRNARSVPNSDRVVRVRPFKRTFTLAQEHGQKKKNKQTNR